MATTRLPGKVTVVTGASPGMGAATAERLAAAGHKVYGTSRRGSQAGQRPFEMGYRAPTVMIDLINGKKVADPLFTGLDECVATNLDKCPAK